MRLFDELFKDVEGGAVSRCTVVPCGGGYFEGVKAVGDFPPNASSCIFLRRACLRKARGWSLKNTATGICSFRGRYFPCRS